MGDGRLEVCDGAHWAFVMKESVRQIVDRSVKRLQLLVLIGNGDRGAAGHGVRLPKSLPTWSASCDTHLLNGEGRSQSDSERLGVGS